MLKFHMRCAVAAAAMAVLAPSAGFAQMARLEITAPGGPGSGQDQVARAVADALQNAAIVSNVQVVNIAGGGGMVAIAQFISSKDGDGSAVVSQGAGHVLFPISNQTPVSLNDVTPVARLAGEYEVLVTKADSGIDSVAGLLEMYAADPGSVTWAGGSPAATDHVFMANLISGGGQDAKLMNFIPHENTGEVVIAVLGGQVSVGAGGYQDFGQQVESGDLKVLAVGAPERLPNIDAPTLREEGIDLVFANWRGVSAHKSLSEEQLVALDEVFAGLVQSDRWKEIMAERGWLDLYMDRPAYTQFIQDDIASATEALRNLGMIQ